MKICVLTETKWLGKIPADFEKNLQWDILLQKEIDSFHVSYLLKDLDKIVWENFDIVLTIPPKTLQNIYPLYKEISNKTTLIVMQEGSRDHWMDYDVPRQMDYINALSCAACLLVPNKIDKTFYEGIIKTPVKTFMIFTDIVLTQKLAKEESSKKFSKSMMIGANFSLRSYGLADVHLGSGIIKNYGVPTMRKTEADNNVLYINDMLKKNAVQYDYMEQQDWLKVLNKYSVGVHLANEFATGQFQLQCACLGIPCIGNSDQDIQNFLFPELAIRNNDIVKGRELLKKLLKDKQYRKSIVSYAYKKVALLDTSLATQKFKNMLEEIHKEHNTFSKRLLRKITN